MSRHGMATEHDSVVAVARRATGSGDIRKLKSGLLPSGPSVFSSAIFRARRPACDGYHWPALSLFLNSPSPPRETCP